MEFLSNGNGKVAMAGSVKPSAFLGQGNQKEGRRWRRQRRGRRRRKEKGDPLVLLLLLLLPTKGSQKPHNKDITFCFSSTQAFLTWILPAGFHLCSFTNLNPTSRSHIGKLMKTF